MGRVATLRERDSKSYTNEIDGFSVLLTFAKPKANRIRKRRQFDDFSLVQGVASLRPIILTSLLTPLLEFAACALPGKKMQAHRQDQKHCPCIHRNMQAPLFREE